MDYETFKKKLTEKFNFKDGWFKGEGDETYLGFVDPQGTKYEIAVFSEIPITDTDTHFAAMAILDEGSNEFVHIREKGKYYDHVFWNCHEEGLYSVDCIEDYEDDLDMDAYAEMSKDERIEQFPWMEYPLAKNLQELFDGIRAFTKDEFWGD